jgi:hypothetical protein
MKLEVILDSVVCTLDEHLGPCVAERYLTIRFLRTLHFVVAFKWSSSSMKQCPVQHICNYITQWLSRWNIRNGRAGNMVTEIPAIQRSIVQRGSAEMPD